MWGAHSDERSTLLLGLARAVILGSKSRETRYHLPSQMWLPQSGGPGSSIYFPRERGDPIISPITGSVEISQSYLTTDGQSASLSWGQATIKARDKFFFLLEIFFRQLQVYYFVAPSLTKGWVCNLLLLLGLASAIPLGSKSRGNQNHILLSQLLRLHNLEDQFPVFKSPTNRVAQLHPRSLGSLFVASYDS
jgi:hypothetical protein